MAERLTAKAPGDGWIALAARLGGLHDDLLSFPDFAKINRRPTGNDALACGPSRCGPAPADMDVPVFEFSGAELSRRVQEVALADARTVLRRVVGETGLEFQQASAVLRYPDSVSGQIIPLGPSQSTLAIWSRSVVGRKDFGVNRARVERWLASLRR